MRFRSTATIPLATYGAISLFNLYVILLYFAGDLTLYIHPRYVLFTLIFNAFSLIACSTGFAVCAYRTMSVLSYTTADTTTGDSPGGTSHEPSNETPLVQRITWRPSFTFLVAALLLGVAYLLPASPLSSGTAHQRADNLNTGAASPLSPSAGQASKTSAPVGAIPEFSWEEAAGPNPGRGLQEGTPVDAVGFVFQPEGAPDGTFYVSRFVVTCCAVDARPIGIPVHSPGWQQKFEEDAWVRVRGSFASSPVVGGALIVEPTDLEPTEQPRNPYVS